MKYRFTALILLLTLLPLCAMATNSPAPTTTTETVDFEVIEAHYIGTMVDIVLHATPKKQAVSLVANGDYDEAYLHGSVVWMIDCEVDAKDTAQTWLSVSSKRDKAGLFVYLTLPLQPVEPLTSAEIDITCKVYEPSDYERASEYGSITLNLPHEESESVSFDVLNDESGFNLTNIFVEKTSRGLHTVISGCTADETIPILTHVIADGQKLEMGNGVGSDDEDTRIFTMERVWDYEGAFPSLLVLNLNSTDVVLDLLGKAVLNTENSL